MAPKEEDKPFSTSSMKSSKPAMPSLLSPTADRSLSAGRSLDAGSAAMFRGQTWRRRRGGEEEEEEERRRKRRRLMTGFAKLMPSGKQERSHDRVIERDRNCSEYGFQRGIWETSDEGSNEESDEESSQLELQLNPDYTISFQHYHTGLYVCMDRDGLLYGGLRDKEKCHFREEKTAHFSSYYSEEFRKKGRKRLVAIRKDGESRPASKIRSYSMFTPVDSMETGQEKMPRREVARVWRARMRQRRRERQRERRRRRKQRLGPTRQTLAVVEATTTPAVVDATTTSATPVTHVTHTTHVRHPQKKLTSRKEKWKRRRREKLLRLRQWRTHRRNRHRGNT
ncbi:unnamed protein product [Darwinula stevensoni]|uniref:FGF n=1 Tax=Darwinula stevensoni TaxID=69355 RepID=A0A7R9FSB1_9CRUS|nr:unnamed protein product [Darwinula stevensoni]CAG0903403.1 unnamed protein product [Darwinula stevensoni]